MQDDDNQGVTLEDNDQSQSTTTPVDKGQDDANQNDQDQQPSDSQGDEGVTDDKGTKDKEPQSQYYQRVKNENAQLRRLLSDPKALKEYAEKNGIIAPSKENQVNEEEEVNKLAAEVVDQNGLINLPKLIKALEDRSIKKVDNLVTSYSQTTQKQIENKIQYNKDLETVYEDHPELNPESKDTYIPEYNEIIGNLYLAQGGLQGKVRLSDVAKKFYAAIGRERQNGSRQANQQIIRKKSGAIQQNANSSNNKQGQDDEASPEATIADRFRKGMGLKN